MFLIYIILTVLPYRFLIQILLCFVQTPNKGEFVMTLNSTQISQKTQREFDLASSLPKSQVSKDINPDDNFALFIQRYPWMLSKYPWMQIRYITQDNPVRVIDVFVDDLELGNMEFKTIPAETGRPLYHPSVMLKLYIYGYLNRVQSSCRLERESGRNVELMWLLGRLAPDFKTIVDFRYSVQDGNIPLLPCFRFGL